MADKEPKEFLRVVGRQEGPGWVVTVLESQHSYHYLTSQAMVGMRPDGTVTREWLMAHQQIVVKPEFLAAATALTGSAVAKAQGQIAAAAQPPCDECGGKPRGPDEAPCWKCRGGRP